MDDAGCDAGVDGARADAEREVRELCTSAAWPAAVERALGLYGAEVAGYLGGSCDRRDDLAEIYADFGAAVVEALPSFEWRSTLRTWMYALARNARRRHQTRRRRDAARATPLSGVVARLPSPVASSIALHHRTTMKERLAAARQQLTPTDRELLILRVDRNMAWLDIAVVMHGELRDGEPAARARVAASLRKRFERTLARLRTEMRAMKVLRA